MKMDTSFLKYQILPRWFSLCVLFFFISLRLFAIEQVTSFTLVNADNKQDMITLNNGSTINLATLITKNINIRANTAPSVVGRVVFSLTGTQNRNQTENAAPYFLFGGDYIKVNPWTPLVGSYYLKAMPYSDPSGGIAGTSLAISFKVINQPVNQLPVANAGTDVTITLPTNKITLSGSGIDFDGIISGYSWSQVSGPSTAVFNSKTVTNPTISGLVAGSYTFNFIVKDNLNALSKPDQIIVTVKSVLMQQVKINFQDPQTIPPTGWLRDFGQPFGIRNGQYQNANLSYGWKKRTDGTLLNLSVGGTTPGNGRNRSMLSSILASTLMHMQADDIPGSFNGTKTEGYWELKVPNGNYEVTVSVGDAAIHLSPESHSINVEGVKAIINFKPSGSTGALTRFKTATVRVSVLDQHLTINADGGINTKINSIQVTPLTADPIIFWSAKTQNLVVIKGSTSTINTFSLDLSNSLNKTNIQYALSAIYSAGGTNWLSFNPTHASSEPNVTFNYAGAGNLPAGVYKATITASATGFIKGSFEVQLTVEATRPYVISSTPVKGATNVSVNTASVAANNLYVPEVAPYKGGVDNNTITNNTVKLLKIVAGTSMNIMGVVQGTGGGDAISFTPTYAFEPNTVYKFVVTDGVKSYSGASFIPYEATFTTGNALNPSEFLPVEFAKIPIPGTQNKKYTTLTFGPDGKFYALRIDGVIERYTVQADGMLSGLYEIKTLVNKYGERSAVGLTFDKRASATNMIVWVSHCSSGLDYAPEFDGNVSRLTGSKLENEQLVITKLPRSRKDHLVNSMAFGPDGALYISQGSNSSMGAYDGSWQRIESLLSGAILRLDFNKLAAVTLPLNVYTTANQLIINNAPATGMRMSDGSYNPYGSTAPLTIYASGVRNAYDLVWHTNGQLYVPANGSAAGGNSPASVMGTRRPNGTFYDGPAIPSTSTIQVQNDWLFRMNPLKPIGYFGHPNPLRGEYIANRGYIDNIKYPSSLGPDLNYRGAAYNFELNKSPNGALEYKSNSFNGALKGKILVCRFSGGGDIMILEPGSLIKDQSVVSASSNDKIYDIVSAVSGAGTNGPVGMSGFTNPLDIVEDTKTGNLYVSEFNWNNSSTKVSQLTLLKVQQTTALDGLAMVYPASISANEVVGSTETQSYPITISNTGKGMLTVTGIKLTGIDASQFKVKGKPNIKPNKPLKIPKNSAITLNLSFNPATIGFKKAKLQVISKKNEKNKLRK